MVRNTPHDRKRIRRYSLQILQRIEDTLEFPLVVLGFVWLILLVLELLGRLNRLGETLSTAIYIVFVIDFVVRFLLAPEKVGYLRRNWLTALTLVLPALRIFRIARVLRVASRARSLSVVRLLGSLNRGMAALGKSMRRRGLGYISVFTLIVLIVGAAGMLYFERDVPDGLLDSYSEAIWWTAMLMTSLGSEYWPKTPEGRFLCVVLSIYSLAVFTYLTGAVATFFIGRDAEDEDAEVAGAKQIKQLEKKIERLHVSLAQLTAKLDSSAAARVEGTAGDDRPPA